MDRSNSYPTSDSPKEAISTYPPQAKEAVSSQPPVTARSFSTSSSIVPLKHPTSRSLLFDLPQELLDMIVSNSLIPHNGCGLDFDYRYMDVTTMGGKRFVHAPKMPTLTRLNQRLRFLTLLASFKNARIDLIHDSVAKTVDFLSRLPAPIRNSIQGLGIKYKKDKPVDYMSFHVLCRILDTMTALKVLKITVPTHFIRPRRRLPGLSRFQRLRNDVSWRREVLVGNEGCKWDGPSEYDWRTAPTAAWVLDLLSVTAAGFSKFEIHTSPGGDGLRVANFLNVHMLEDPATRRHLIEQLKMQLEEHGRRYALFWELLAFLWHVFFEEMAIVWFAWLDFLP